MGSAMICTCAICGFSGDVYDYEEWTRGQFPKLWICDICYVDLNNS